MYKAGDKVIVKKGYSAWHNGTDIRRHWALRDGQIIEVVEHLLKHGTYKCRTEKGLAIIPDEWIEPAPTDPKT